MKSHESILDGLSSTVKGSEGFSAIYDKATKDKINKHLTDINDHITEEDIRNIDTGITQKLLHLPGKA